MIISVDPDASARATTEAALSEAGFTTQGGESIADARELLQTAEDVECLVTEYSLPDGTGLELIEEVRQTDPDAACILFTATPLEEIETEAYDGMIAEYLGKDVPAAREELVALIEHSLAFQSQTAYPLPNNEEARVAALDRYATDPESLGTSLDRLSELATALFGVNSAGIGLIDAHHERFLGCHGASFGTLDREASICTYAILDPEVTVIENVPEDPRFMENEGLADAGIEFYAGAPLITPDGHAIGVFCIHDDTPRAFTDREQRLLKLLAEEAMEQLELRRRLTDGEGRSTDE
ncbi:MAG: response regulator [Halobacteriales archaeon]|nr:response regulator [Halobacteriales archaeon]